MTFTVCSISSAHLTSVSALHVAPFQLSSIWFRSSDPVCFASASNLHWTCMLQPLLTAIPLLFSSSICLDSSRLETCPLAPKRMLQALHVASSSAASLNVESNCILAEIPGWISTKLRVGFHRNSGLNFICRNRVNVCRGRALLCLQSLISLRDTC
ncbi:hypothetical protein C8R43DRAFT_1039590 [Mycena crocata]|nr:hypothetical protein C8R43DRAFT_1039590 [Mycena crocata]